MTIRLLRRDHLEAIIWGLIFAAITSLPYLMGYLASPPDRYFLGFVLNPGDQNTYFMWMTQAAAGDILLRKLYTSIEHGGAMLNLFFLGGGVLGRVFGSLDLSYQILRILAVVLLSWSLWTFVATFAADRRQCRWLFLLCVFGAGLGWAWNVGRWFTGDYGGTVADTDLLGRPFDLWVPEGYVFFSMLVMPHFTAAIALLLLTVRWAALGLRDDRIGLTAAAGLLCAILSFVHPYDVLVVLTLSLSVVVLYSLRHRCLEARVWRHTLLLVAIAVGPILYNYWILHENPGMAAWLAQNKSFSPPPRSYLLGYGVLLFGSIAFLVERRHGLGWDLDGWQWLAVWLVILPFAVYAPIDFQRRLVIGASVPMALAMGLWVWGRAQRYLWWSRPRARAVILLGLLGLVAPTSVFHWLNSFRKVSDYFGEVFVNRAMVEGLVWLGQEAKRSDGTVLSSFETGNIVPRFTGLTAVIGSRGQTGNFDRVLAETRAFYAGKMTSAEMHAWLDRQRVTWVVVGPDENQLGGNIEDRLAALRFRLRYRSADDRVGVYGLD